MTSREMTVVSAQPYDRSFGDRIRSYTQHLVATIGSLCCPLAVNVSLICVLVRSSKSFARC
ncbi:hypothetical protein BD310DRAFT_700769 [Dichomitus squalens]|uniref:Uncharacterized protein n=1 Tax=Dichomitus squalens TaxID=114155 RepID=A0A4Q9Q5Q1_9APHY|nr:hypothetical protein BD310DRAFT_700769 [Dichomitus squalens]